MPRENHHHRGSPWRGRPTHSVRALFAPGLVLQLTALALVLAYGYFLPAAHGFFARLAGLAKRGRLRLLRAVHRAVRRRAAVSFPAAQSGHARRLSVAASSLSSRCSGRGRAWRSTSCIARWPPSLATIPRPPSSPARSSIDQFGYNLLYAAPVGSLVFAWKDAGFRWAPVAADVRAGRWYYRRAFPVLLAVWALWIPVVCCVYALAAGAANAALQRRPLLLVAAVRHDHRAAEPGRRWSSPDPLRTLVLVVPREQAR